MNKRMGTRCLFLSALLSAFCFIYSPQGVAEDKACNIDDQYISRYGQVQTIDLGSVTGIYDNIIDIPAEPKLLGTKKVNLFERDTDIVCSDRSGSNAVDVHKGAGVTPGYDLGLDPEGRTLFLVNSTSPGLAYSLEVICEGDDREGECKSHSNDTLPVVDNRRWSSQDGRPWDDGNLFGRRASGDNFKLNVYFWQLPSWRPAPYGTGTVGSNFIVFGLSIGGGKSISYDINLNFVPKEPTCDTEVIMKGNPAAEINLGDSITPKQLAEDAADKVPFTLVLSNCSAIVDSVFVRMTTTKRAENNPSLLGKQNGSATGVGVKITDDRGNQLIPDGSSTLTYPYAGVLNTRELTLIAQLVSDGTTLRPGDFEAAGTFNITYD